MLEFALLENIYINQKHCKYPQVRYFSITNILFHLAHSYLNCKVFEATSFSTLNYFFHTLNSCRDFTRGWGNQLNLGVAPKCGQSRLRVNHGSGHHQRCLLREVTDELGHGLRWKVRLPEPPAECHPQFSCFKCRFPSVAQDSL